LDLGISEHDPEKRKAVFRKDHAQRLVRRIFDAVANVIGNVDRGRRRQKHQLCIGGVQMTDLAKAG
jgi:hypothetical protein